MELTPEQLLLIGLAASVLTQLFKFVFDKAGWKPGAEIQMVILFIVAAGLAFAFFGQAFLADPINSLLGIVGVAVAIYKLLLQKVVFPAVRLS